MLLFYLFIIAFILIYVHLERFYKRKNHFEKLLRDIPTTDDIQSYPIFGHALHLKKYLSDTVRKNDFIKFESTPFKVWFFNNPIVFVFRPEDVNIVLKSSKCLEKHFLYNSFKNALGSSLPIASHKIWKKNRRIVSQAFHTSIVDSFVPIFYEKISMLLEILRRDEGKLIDIYDPIFNCTVDIICSTAFDLPVDMQINPDSNFIAVLKREREILVKRMTNGLYANDFFYQFTSMSREENKMMTSMEDLYKSKFSSRKLEAEKLCEEDVGSKKRLYDHLVDVQKNSSLLSDQELVDEIRGFMIAGSETTSLTTSFALILLALHKNVQQKVYEEVINVIGTDRNINTLDLPQLVYLDQVIKETLRLFPPGTFIGREAVDDIKLQNCTIPKGSGIWVGLAAMMRSEKYFKDPLKFIPERFSSEDVQNLYPFSYNPFSAGPRNCLGKQYAMNEMKILISMIIREFTVETTFKDVEDIACDFHILLTSIKDYPLQLSSRNNNNIIQK